MKFVLTAVVLSVLPAATAVAQNRMLAAHIPFDFQIGETPLPAGRYDLDTGVIPGAILIRRDDRRATAVVLTHAVQAKGNVTEGKLVFNRYGEEHFLSQVWTPGYSQGRELKPSKREREIARSGSRAPSVVSAAISGAPVK